MTIPTTGKGCRVHAANAFLNHVHVLEENGFDPHQTFMLASSTVHFSANTHPKNGIK